MTMRARQFNSQNENRPFFPSVGDEICVKWVWNERSVWWPATVTSIGTSGIHTRTGELHYHKYKDYDRTQTSVLFSVSSGKQRFVRSTGPGCRNSSGASSWLYSDERSSDDENNSECDSAPRAPRPIRKPGMKSTVPDISGPSGRSTEPLGIHDRSIQRSRTDRKFGSARFKNSSKPDTVSHQLQQDDSNSTAIKTEDKLKSEQQIDQTASIATVDGSANKQMGVHDEKWDLELRLELLERRVHDFAPTNSSELSSSTLSVIVSLRWALLKALEKPLRSVLHPSLDEYGVAPQHLSVTAQCDYRTFREIAAALAKEHRFSSVNSAKSRVAFSPAFHTTQSGSNACDNMNILFACLADLTTFLRIRDDNDFEAILSKELLSDRANILRILGTFSVSEVDEHCGFKYKTDGPGAIGTSTSTDSVSASSESVSVLRLFVGSSPVDFEERTGQDVSISPSTRVFMDRFTSTILQQECRHFCPTQKCFQSEWTARNIESKMTVNCSFDLDGTVGNDNLENYFVLNWTRQAAPSLMKWTKDVHEVGNNSPGRLRLSIPYMLFTSTRNVRRLESKLDSHIETFMNVRSSLHNMSSFK